MLTFRISQKLGKKNGLNTIIEVDLIQSSSNIEIESLYLVNQNLNM
jgi:hypothetical protein